MNQKNTNRAAVRPAGAKNTASKTQKGAPVKQTGSIRAKSGKPARSHSLKDMLFSRANDKPMNIWVVLLIDALIVGAALCVFALFDHVLVQEYETPETASQLNTRLAARQNKASATPTPFVSASPVVGQETEPDATPTPEITSVEATPAPTPEAEVLEEGMFSFPGKFTNGEIEITEDSYRSANINVTIQKHESKGKYLQRYYIAHIYVKDILCLQSVFAKDTYGKGISEEFISMSKRSNSVIAINTDFYNFARHPKSMLIRNGQLFGAEPSDEYDLLVINFDGTMDVYRKGKSPDGQTLINNGALHTFCFGPILLEDGKKLSSYDDVARDPRTAIGMVEPGHYVFLVCEGRSSTAKGYTYKGLADILLGEGCVVGYNLDGGDSAQMAFMGEMVNDPSRDGRAVSDVFIIAEPESFFDWQIGNN